MCSAPEKDRKPSGPRFSVFFFFSQTPVSSRAVEQDPGCRECPPTAQMPAGTEAMQPTSDPEMEAEVVQPVRTGDVGQRSGC